MTAKSKISSQYPSDIKAMLEFRSVRAEAVDKPLYMKLTIEDAYLIFSILIILTIVIFVGIQIYRNGDVTLADLGLFAKNIKMRDYDRSIMCLIVQVRRYVFNKIKRIGL